MPNFPWTKIHRILALLLTIIEVLAEEETNSTSERK